MTETAERRPRRRDAVPEAHAGSGTGLRLQRQPPVTLAEALAELVEVSGSHDRWEQRLQAACRAAYLAGHADGRAAERLEADRAWAARPARIVRDGPALGDLERQRWTVRGEPRDRLAFGLPHSDDYPGQDGAA